MLMRASIHPALSKLGSGLYQGRVHLVGLGLGQVEAFGNERRAVPVSLKICSECREGVALSKCQGAASVRFTAGTLGNEACLGSADLLNHPDLREARINGIGDGDQVVSFATVDLMGRAEGSELASHLCLSDATAK
jgi:hypothetical protein